MYQDEFTQTQEPMEAAPYGPGIGGEVGGEVHIDGTPMRLVTIVGAGILFLVIVNRGGLRFHVAV